MLAHLPCEAWSIQAASEVILVPLLLGPTTVSLLWVRWSNGAPIREVSMKTIEDLVYASDNCYVYFQGAYTWSDRQTISMHMARMSVSMGLMVFPTGIY